MIKLMDCGVNSPRLGIQEEKLGEGRVDKLSYCCLPYIGKKCPDGSWLYVLKLKIWSWT